MSAGCRHANRTSLHPPSPQRTCRQGELRGGAPRHARHRLLQLPGAHAAPRPHLPQPHAAVVCGQKGRGGNGCERTAWRQVEKWSTAWKPNECILKRSRAGQPHDTQPRPAAAPEPDSSHWPVGSGDSDRTALVCPLYRTASVTGKGCRSLGLGSLGTSTSGSAPTNSGRARGSHHSRARGRITGCSWCRGAAAQHRPGDRSRQIRHSRPHPCYPPAHACHPLNSNPRCQPWLATPPTLDDEALAAGAGAQIQVQAALKALLDEGGVRGHLPGSRTREQHVARAQEQHGDTTLLSACWGLRVHSFLVDSCVAQPLHPANRPGLEARRSPGAGCHRTWAQTAAAPLHPAAAPRSSPPAQHSRRSRHSRVRCGWRDATSRRRAGLLQGETPATHQTAQTAQAATVLPRSAPPAQQPPNNSPTTAHLGGQVLSRRVVALLMPRQLELGGGDVGQARGRLVRRLACKVFG